jgi:hypothetical protein
MKKILVCSFLTVLSVAYAQQRKAKPVLNLPFFDTKPLHYGFIFAINYASYSLKPSQYFYDSADTLRRVEPSGGGGFTVGGIVNLRLHDYFDLRITPQYAFYEKGVSYTFVDKLGASTLTEQQLIEASLIELPMLVKYKSKRRDNFRVYVIGGIKPSLSLSNKNKDQRPDKLRFNSYDVAVDYGLGCEIYYPLFKLSPEIRLSNGLLDMKAPDQNMYANAIQNLRSQTITFMLNFE